MRATRLLDDDWGGASFQRAGDTLLVVVDTESEPGTFDDRVLAAVFDLRSRRPLSPVHSFDQPVRLGSLPRFGPEPVLAFTTATSLVVADMRDGSVLETLPLPDTLKPWRRHGECDLAVGRCGGRDLLFLHEHGEGLYGHWVRAVDLATGEPMPDLACSHYRYKEVSERLTLGHGYLAWPTTEETVEFWADGFSVIDKPFVYVQRADDGSWVGKVGLYDGVPGVPEERAVEIAHAAGRTYLAEAGTIVTLPDLKPVFPKEDPWVLVSRVTEWGGRPVAVLVRNPYSSQEPPVWLCHLFLDTDTPDVVVIPWEVPAEVHDLAATPDGTIVVSSAEGVHVIEVDPQEAARAGRAL
ncbi:hypothetical protein DFP74_3876 [Nocardiopsis sp. Huas11]|uniref:hypothetical protein n=1 Tax=Nocardiopsis sp. Huas11 TaxID=2183912 RepID=UPI000EACD441|nr:hypothetical protein [Nocardiopsis sp. Huas11]RKS08182.1 hypothetical protein DFP74_3876 [Nocardiopsis sp. Huas11]